MRFMELAKVEDVARKEGLSYGKYVAKYRPNENTGKKKTERQDGRSKIEYDELVDLYISGLSMQQIAYELGVSESGVRKYIKRMRILR